MTDRINSFLVVLEHDIRADDAEHLITAMNLFKGVISVTPNIGNVMDIVAEERARIKIIKVVWEALQDKT